MNYPHLNLMNTDKHLYKINSTLFKPDLNFNLFNITLNISINYNFNLFTITGFLKSKI